MKLLLSLLLIAFTISNAQAQLLKKLKQKAESAAGKVIDKSIEKKEVAGASTENSTEKTAAVGAPSNLKVYSKFDFVPGATILYYDNFEKDNIGEAPLGWITTSSAEVVTIDGLEGQWLKLASTSSKHFTRSKKQSWGNNFTVEFDLLMVKNEYDPRIDINLINTDGNLVTDENILRSGKKPAVNFSAIVVGENRSRASLYALDRKLSDVMTETLPYSNTVPVHVSMCVQGKRFRLWWNDRKLYDLSAVNEEYLPNQLGFAFSHIGGSEYYLGNIRIAKDVPDTRAKLNEGKLISNLLFFTGTAKLKPESMGALLDVSKILKDASAPVKIIGHTDADGEEAANLKLSQQRAEAVKAILVSEYNIEESKLSTEGRGEAQPIAENKSSEGKAQNRRVEFIFKAEADKYIRPAGAAITTDTKTSGNAKAAVSNNNDVSAEAGTATVKLQSKLVNINLPFAQIMKTGDNQFTFIATKEEGNSKEFFFKLMLVSVNPSLKPETFNFKELNQKQPLYGTKKYAEIKKTEAVLYYGAGQKPYIYQFSPIIANGTMASYVDAGLGRNLPTVSPNSKFVIEKVENGKASGYFIFGIMIEGLKPITKGDAMQQTFTDGFAGEMKGSFSNVPVY